MSEQEPPKNGPDEVIYELGGCGQFQIRFAVLIHLLNVVVALSIHLMVYSGTAPTWRCVDDVNATESINKSLEESCKTRNGTQCSSFEFEEEMHIMVDEVYIFHLLKPIALRNAKIAYNFDLSERSMVKHVHVIF